MELQQLRSTGDTVLIHIPQVMSDTLLVGGVELWFDPAWHPIENKNLGGVLVAVPEQVGDSYLLSRKGNPPQRVPVSAIQEVLAVGDYVYADYTVSEDGGKLKVPELNLPDVGGVYRARLNQLVARVREGRLEPYGSYVLLKEIYPDDVEAVEVPGFPGKMRLRVSASGLTMGTEQVPALPFQGVVTHVGLPLRGQPCRVKVGDRVVLDKAMCGADKRPLKMKMQGEEYLCIRQDYIHAILEEVVEVPSPEELLGYFEAVGRDGLKPIDWSRYEQPSTPEGAAGADRSLEFEYAGQRRFVSKEAMQKEYAFRESVRGRPYGAVTESEWFKLPTVPTGFSFDIRIIEGVFKSLGETPNLTRFIKCHQTGEPYMVGSTDLIQLVREQGGITANESRPAWGKYSNGNYLTTTVPPIVPDERPQFTGPGLLSLAQPKEIEAAFRGLSVEFTEADWLDMFLGPKRDYVTTCCGAGHYRQRLTYGGEPIEYCKACNQVAHLIPASEFSQHPPAA